MSKISISLTPPPLLVVRHDEEEYSATPYRTEFQRDRDRILYSKEFRRLSGKTQVFLTQSNDHIRTRLTHTLEVAQIARVVASNLNLCATLPEAIAYGHDVGHTPFGHVGERTLSLIMNNCDKLADCQNGMQDSPKGFKHNLQSLRVVCDLEQNYERTGLNLTNFTLWGIKNHSSIQWKDCSHQDSKKKMCHLKRNPILCEEGVGFNLDFYDKYNKLLNIKNDNQPAWSFEGLVVAISDEIAQRHHDIEDALSVGIITNDELMEKLKSYFWKLFDSEDRHIYADAKDAKMNGNLFLQKISKLIVNFLTKNLILNSNDNLNSFVKKYKIKSEKDFHVIYKSIKNEDVLDAISYRSALAEADKKMQKFLRDRILNSFEVQRMDGKGNYILRGIFKAYLTNPRQLHDSTIYYILRQFSPGKYPEWSEITKENLGEMRNEIDSARLRSENDFQICLLRGICDHLAGMTDKFAIEEHRKLYG